MSTEVPAPEVAADRSDSPRGRAWLYGIVPLVLLGVLLAVFFASDPLSGLREDVPPVEELTFDRVVLSERPKEIAVHVTNGGPDPVTIAQVLVDESYWAHEITPDRRLGRLGSATIRIPYPWVNEEAHEIVIISSTGVTFAHEIEVAVATPRTDAETLAVFTLLGIFVGVIPVALGLLWFPFVRRIDQRWIGFFLALTAGLLVFLAVDALVEAVELAEEVPGAFQGTGLIAIGVIVALAALFGLDAWLRRRRQTVGPLFVAMLIATGIGLHNLGEGLAIGAAYAIGEVALTTFLVVGFMLHNVTEGLGIVSPLARTDTKLWHLAVLGAIAGLPTIAGTWIGGLAFSPALAVLFLSIGVGAIIQVVWEIGKLMRQSLEPLAAPLQASGFVAGVAVMYLTGLLVVA